MRVLLLSDVNSIHTRRWAASLKEAGVDPGIFSLAEPKETWCEDYGIPLFLSRWQPKRSFFSKAFSKIFYPLQICSLKKAIQTYHPDIIHAHYASSYGLLGALSGFHPFILSVWGSDIFEFPKISFFHRMVLRYNLANADKILSTSQAMARETNKYINKNIEITPFGVDLTHFIPQKVDSLFNEKDIVIGTVKALEPIYGIRCLMKAFQIVKGNNRELPLKLLIVGSGSEEMDLKKLAKDLAIQNDVVFTGRVGFSDVPRYHNMISIYVALSTFESFGVSIVEAQATETPVVVSNVGGLPEVVEDGVTGFVIEPKNPVAAAKAIESLVHDKALRERMGKNGRQRVIANYNWNDSLAQMIAIYREVMR